MLDNDEGIQLWSQHVQGCILGAMWSIFDNLLPPSLSIQAVYEMCPKFIILDLVTLAVVCNKPILHQMNFTH